jgi:LysM repeat protein
MVSILGYREGAAMRRFTLVLICILALILVFGTTSFAQESTSQQQIHIVAPGENLFRISLRYNVTIAAIQSANNIPNPNRIFVGQQLVIPGATGAPPPQPGPQPTPDAQPTVYVVVRGDTLSSIARRFNTTFQAIAAANGITNPNLIFVGQQLTIAGAPPPGTAPPPPPPPSAPITGGFELGGHVDSFRHPDQMRGAGMTWVKRQIVWHRGQGPEIAQGAIDQARSNGFKILLGVVGDTGQLGANRTQYIQEYANFLAALARLNPDGIEVWNEPNIDRQWPTGQISGAAYTEMLRAAYTAIKNANPNVLVISGAPAPTGAESAFPGRVVNDDRFIQQMAASGAANYMDCVGLHYNEGILPPTARSGDPRGNSGFYTRYYPTMVSLYSGVFPNKPLCFTELGYLTPEGLGPLPPAFAWAANVTAQQQAEWLGQAVTLSRNSGRVRLLIVWNVDFTRYDNDPMAGYAIIRPDGTCRACVIMRAAMGL